MTRQERIQLAFAEDLERRFLSRYPYVVSTGGSLPRPETVEALLGIYLCRIPFPYYGFVLWGFSTAHDLQQFLRHLPVLAPRREVSR